MDEHPPRANRPAYRDAAEKDTVPRTSGTLGAQAGDPGAPPARSSIGENWLHQADFSDDLDADFLASQPDQRKLIRIDQPHLPSHAQSLSPQVTPQKPESSAITALPSTEGRGARKAWGISSVESQALAARNSLGEDARAFSGLVTPNEQDRNEQVSPAGCGLPGDLPDVGPEVAALAPAVGAPPLQPAPHRLERRQVADPVQPIEAILAARGLYKSFVRGSTRVEVLRGLDLEVTPGEFLAIVGHSGSGKSTLLHLLATLDRPDEGEIHFRTRRIDNISARGRDRLRNRHFGMVFQMYHLLPELTALENVMLPLMIGHGPLGLVTRWRSFRRQAWQWLEAVGLAHRAHHKPRELSGGEMQRTAIARALVHRPDVLFADEPTGNLDRKTGWEILDLLRALNRREKLTIVMVTHDPQVAQSADRILQLFDGRLYPAS
ncbi:MAG: ABC transporter ATP-binding protein [Thermoguttaceae bacterium]|nr:ABC transporter ATP-binding protein [Thermoguttaceae bacterium]MDW8077333.1 ABC transporter ATP-binding protein [Thermoguttaceae bacterium]